MNRFFVDKKNILRDDEKIIIDDIEDFKHITKVLRLGSNELLEICDKDNGDYLAQITDVHKDKLELKILDCYPSKTEPNIQVTLFQGIPKSNKMELIIQKCTELGITEIIPLETQRTIVQLKDEKAEDKKLDRWQKIADEAAKQCKRGILPRIGKPKTFKNMLESMKAYDLAIIPYENESQSGIKALLSNDKAPKRVAIIIGPEGGFEEREIKAAQDAGVISVTLGPRILRTETAGFVALSILMYELGDLGGK